MVRKRTEIRSAQRDAVKDAKLRLKLATLEVGGDSERPIRVSSASIVEPHVESMPCVVCGAKVRALSHEVIHRKGEVIRHIEAKCVQCGITRPVYLVASALAN
jgi:hypothetical protein